MPAKHTVPRTLFCLERAVGLPIVYFYSSLVGSVPTCKLAAILWKDYHVGQPHGSGQIPIGGVILQSALYSGKKTFFGGCLLGSQDPYDNASEIVYIEV